MLAKEQSALRKVSHHCCVLLRLPARWSRQRLVVVVVTISIIIFIYENRWLEHNIFKPLGRITDNTKNFNIPFQDNLIVFQHIPRTAGDALRTHLFNGISISRSHDSQANCNANYHGRWPFPDLSELKQANAIAGYYSTHDLMQLPALIDRNLTLWTVLRDPVERVVAEYNFRKGFCNAHPTPEGVSVVPFEEYFADNISRLSKSERNNRLFYMHNPITWQLGYHVHPDERAINIDEALKRAKAHLHRMKFIGFFENLCLDSIAMLRTIFPHMDKYDVFHYLMHEFGACVTTFKLRTRQHFTRLTKSQQDLVMSKVRYDIELWEYAKQLTGTEITMYDTKIGAILGLYVFNVHSAVAMLLMTACITFACTRGHRTTYASTEIVNLQRKL